MPCNFLISLPLEIQEIIFRFCSPVEQKALRSCCKTLSSNVIPFLYHTVFLDTLPTSMKRVYNIASKDHIGTHVNELIVTTNLLDPCSLRSFERQIRYQEPAALKSLGEELALFRDQTSIEAILSTYSVWQTRHWLETRFERYWKYVRFQKAHLESESMALCSLLMKFKKLRKVTFFKLSDIAKSSSWVELSKDVFSNLEDSFSLHNWTRATADNLNIFASIMLSDDRLGKQLTTLEIDYIACETWETASLHEAWRNLRYLKLRADGGSTKQAKSLVTQGLAMVVQRIPLIEKLQISIVPCCGYLSRIDFYPILSGSAQLTHLQILGIQTGVIDQQHLLDLYQRYQGTLQTLTIRDFHLSKGTWQELLAQLSANADRCNFILEALTDGDGWNIETYIPFCRVIRLGHDPQDMGSEIDG